MQRFWIYYLHNISVAIQIIQRTGNVKNLPGKPDIVLPKYKTVIFIHGCSWHGHEHCKYFVVPETRTEWWLTKINSNKANDAKGLKALQKDGWKITTLWECDLRPTD